MSSTDDMGKPLNLDAGEALPWLEPAADYDDDDAIAPGKLVAMVLGGLVLIGAILGGLWLAQGGGSAGRGELIAAQDEPYKVSPATDGAKQFEGEGDASFKASEGGEPDGRVDPSRASEEPAAAPAAAPAAPAAVAPAAAPAAKAAAAPAPAAAKPGVIVKPAPIAKTQIAASKAPAPASAPAKATSLKPVEKAAPAAAAVPRGGTAMVQLGAFSSEESAAKAWTSLSRRFAYLAPLSRDIARADVGGSTVYRLRASTGSAAAAGDVCARLKVAGESCVLVR